MSGQHGAARGLVTEPLGWPALADVCVPGAESSSGLDPVPLTATATSCHSWWDLQLPPDSSALWLFLHPVTTQTKLFMLFTGQHFLPVLKDQNEFKHAET